MRGAEMKSVGIISYNIHCNFTNYGSALQSWALCKAIERLGYKPVLMDYCPDVLRDANPLDPFKKMWDKDDESRRMCELTMPAIRENYEKFDRFYTERFNRSRRAYTSENFDECVEGEKLDGFVCGSDTIFCVDEFGVDDGYYANYECMKGRSVSYAASFGDSHFTDETYSILDERLKNFKAIGIRESGMVSYVQRKVGVPVSQVIDPTMLLSLEDFDTLATAVNTDRPYLLLYARRYNPRMEAYAVDIASRRGLQIIEISLRATNAKHGHEMRYDAGVEEFLGLVKNAAYVVTNSYHGMIVSAHYNIPAVVFSREQCDTKIDELLKILGVSHDKSERGLIELPAGYLMRSGSVAAWRESSLGFLKKSLEVF